MSTRENPYRNGSAYHKVFEAVRAVGQKGISKKELHNAGHKMADITVVLSPRETSSRGDCRGSLSSRGYIYFMEKKARRMIGGMKEPQRFALRWRKEMLPKHNKHEMNAVASQKKSTKATSKTQKRETTKTS